MTEINDEILRDLTERNGLEKAITDVETALAVSTPGTRRTLEDFLENAKKRVTTLDKKISEAVKAHETEVRDKVANIAALAEKESQLNSSEKATYSDFLKEDFFTKHDFTRLEKFYGGPYDRLSEGGRDELSHRVWEGVRHGEYCFTDLPDVVQEKEAKRLHAKLITPSIEQGHLNDIPETDRTDFLRAYDAGKQKEARQILNREGFRQNVSLEISGGVRHQAATTGKSADDSGALAEAVPASAARQPETSAMADAGRTAAALKNVTLVDVAPAPATATLPNALTPTVNGRSPT